MANPTNLYEYYTQKGQALPSLAERSKIYEQSGLGSAADYISQNQAGSLAPNTALLAKLLGGQSTTSQPTGNTVNSLIQPTPTPTANQQVSPELEAGVKKAGETLAGIQKQVAAGITPTPAPTPTPTSLATSAPKTPEEVDTLLAGMSTDLSTEKRASADLYASIQGILNKPAPATPSLTETYQTQRTIAGLPQLETDYNTAVSDVRSLQNEIISQQEQIKSQPGVSSRYIDRKLVKLTADNSEALRAAEQKVSDLATQVDTKNKSVSLIMDFAKTDYSNASSNYEFQYNKAIQIYSLYSQQQDKATNNAQASLKVIQDSIKDGSIDPTALNSYQKQIINDLEVKAGQPIGITEFLQSNVKQKIFWQGVQKDETGNNVLIAIPENADGTPDFANTYKVVVGKGTPTGGGGITPSGKDIQTTLFNVGIPTAVSTSAGALNKSYYDAAIAAKLTPDIVNGLWSDIIEGFSFEEIRQTLREQKIDPAVLDTFVQILQKGGLTPYESILNQYINTNEEPTNP